MPEPVSKDALVRQLAEGRAISAEQQAGRETLRALQLEASAQQTVRELQLQLEDTRRELSAELAQVQAVANERAQKLERIEQSLPWKLSLPLRVVLRWRRLWLEKRAAAAEAAADAKGVAAAGADAGRGSGADAQGMAASNDASLPSKASGASGGSGAAEGSGTATSPASKESVSGLAAPVPLPDDRQAVLLVLCDAASDDAAFDAEAMCRALLGQYHVCVWLLRPSRHAQALQAMTHEVLLRPASYGDSREAVAEVAGRHAFAFALAFGLETRPVLPALQASGLPVVGVVPDTDHRPVSPAVLREFTLGCHCTVFSSQNTLDQTRLVAHHLTGLVMECIAPPAVERTADDGAGSAGSMGQGGSVAADVSDSAAGTAFVRGAGEAASAAADGKTVAGSGWVRPAYARRVVLGIGPMDADSGVDLFIGCVSALQRRGELPDDVHFVWAGRPAPGPEGEAWLGFLIGQLLRSGLQNRISLLARELPAAALMDHASALLLPSRREALPPEAVQALQGGVPVLCFDSAGGMAAALGEAGLAEGCVAPYPDVDALARRLAVLLSDATRLQACGEAARWLAAERLGPHAYVQRLASLAQRAARVTQQEMDDAAQILASPRFIAGYVDPAFKKGDDRSGVVAAYLRNWKTGHGRRKPCAGFHPGVYRALQADLPAQVDAFADYLRRGEPEGGWNYPVIAVHEPAPSKAVNVRAALHIHAYYPELVPEMLERLKHNATRPDIYVTVKDAAGEAQVRAMLDAHPGGPHHVQVVPNRGRDIGPFLSMVGSTLCDNYAVVGHVHTKQSLHVSDRAAVDAWRHFLLENLLGGAQSGAIADTILGAMVADDQLGIVFPDDPTPWGWDNNEATARLLAGPLGVDTLPAQFNFPAGTMFWIRTDVLRRFVNLGIEWGDYPYEPLGPDGSMLHALERLFGVVPLAMGKRCGVTWVDGVTR